MLFSPFLQYNKTVMHVLENIGVRSNAGLLVFFHCMSQRVNSRRAVSA
jgi:hypothetical protein